MLEIRITAPDLSEAINNLARAIGLAVTKPVGMTIGVVPTNTTSAVANESTPAQETPQQVAPAANPITPATAPQTAQVVQSKPAIPLCQHKDDFTKLYKEIDDIKEKPAKRWDLLVTTIITALVGIVVGYFFRM